MDYLMSAIIGIASSLAASLVFLIAISRVRPRVEISNKIAKWKDWKGDQVFKIKVINKSRRSIININARLHIMIPSVAPNGIVYKSIEVPLQRSDPMEIAPFRADDKDANYAYRFLAYKDIEALWQTHNNAMLRFRIYAVDSLSGFGRVFTRDYHVQRESLVEGDFSFGNTFEIK